MKGDDDVFSPGGESIIPPLHTYTWYIQTYISEHPSTLLIPFGHGKTARDRSTVALPVCCLPFDHANPFSPYPPFGVERPRGLSVDPHFITVHNLIAKSFLIIARPSDTNTRKDTHAPRSPRHYFMQVIPVRRPPLSSAHSINSRLSPPSQTTPGTGTGSRQEHRVAASNATQK
jgi:hypothetical protein